MAVHHERGGCRQRLPNPVLGGGCRDRSPNGGLHMSRIMPLREQIKLTRKLQRIAQRRPLSKREKALADSMAHRAYMREWRRMGA